MTGDRSARDAWLNTRAEEIVRLNPGAAYPEQDREFHAQTMELVYRMARGRTHGRTYALFNADDLAQASYLRMMEGFSSFRGQGFTTWVWMIVGTTFYTLLRSDHRTAATPIDQLASEKSQDACAADELIADHTNVFKEIDFRPWMKCFLDWLRERNSKHAEIMARHLDGMVDQEIARSLDMPYRSVCSVLYRAPRDYKNFLTRTQKERLKKTQQNVR
jgi:RNA polymerase sigma factor (sigma-70 family)